MAFSHPSSEGASRRRRPRVLPLVFLAALGPGVIGLVADNDAGGMLSYLITGASHALLWILPGLAVLGAVTLFVQWLSLRAAHGSGSPYCTSLVLTVGRPAAVAEALALYVMNTLILATEFLGMSLALSLVGVPRFAALPVTLALVLLLTGARRYQRTEVLLLRTAAVSLAFVPALLLIHPTPGAWSAAFSTSVRSPWFLLLALSGNAVAPWMIYWQQNAVLAGVPRTPRERMWDIATGVAAQMGLASVVLLLGALLPGGAAAFASPLQWVARGGGTLPGVLFAVGIFDAGLLAACTISLASLWTLRDAFAAGARRRGEAPNAGSWRWVHAATLAVAAAVAILPGVPAGRIALWAQALPGLWMPVSLVFLGLVLRNRRLMRGHTVGAATQVVLGAAVLVFVAAAVLGLSA